MPKPESGAGTSSVRGARRRVAFLTVLPATDQSPAGPSPAVSTSSMPTQFASMRLSRTIPCDASRTNSPMPSEAALRYASLSLTTASACGESPM